MTSASTQTTAFAMQLEPGAEMLAEPNAQKSNFIDA
jgi:hypothetical protein